MVSTSSASARLVAVDELGPKERERVLELLLSQERVVALLYERTFTAAPTSSIAEPSQEAATDLEGDERADSPEADRA